MKCPHCGKNTKAVTTSRTERAEALVAFLRVEFKRRDVLNKECPAKDIAEIAKYCTENNLQARTTSRSDRLFSLYKHLHAFAEDLKPYGDKSRRAGYYRVWMTTKYGVGKAAELISRAEELYKEL